MARRILSPWQCDSDHDYYDQFDCDEAEKTTNRPKTGANRKTATVSIGDLIVMGEGENDNRI